mmetsp:Transcript_49522/g.137244  ORF Transcript_49522/g.137244 Transcript_49522/m.137244 type:complete len:246 (+) Transcript_49522:2039-2776(+)
MRRAVGAGGGRRAALLRRRSLGRGRRRRRGGGGRRRAASGRAGADVLRAARRCAGRGADPARRVPPRAVRLVRATDGLPLWRVPRVRRRRAAPPPQAAEPARRGRRQRDGAAARRALGARVGRRQRRAGADGERARPRVRLGGDAVRARRGGEEDELHHVRPRRRGRHERSDPPRGLQHQPGLRPAHRNARPAVRPAARLHVRVRDGPAVLVLHRARVGAGRRAASRTHRVSRPAGAARRSAARV